MLPWCTYTAPDPLVYRTTLTARAAPDPPAAAPICPLPATTPSRYIIGGYVHLLSTRTHLPAGAPVSPWSAPAATRR